MRIFNYFHRRRRGREERRRECVREGEGGRGVGKVDKGKKEMENDTEEERKGRTRRLRN